MTKNQAIRIPLHRGGQQLSDGGAGTGVGGAARRLREMAAESNTHMEFQESVLPKTQKCGVQFLPKIFRHF